MKTDLFQPHDHCWVFQIRWHIECSTFTASSFRTQNSPTAIPSPPLALFIVMLPKARLTSHSRMFDSRWAITPSWLSESWRSFLYSSSVYSCPLFLISSAQRYSVTHVLKRNLTLNDNNDLRHFIQSDRIFEQLSRQLRWLLEWTATYLIERFWYVY